MDGAGPFFIADLTVYAHSERVTYLAQIGYGTVDSILSPSKGFLLL